MLFIRIFSLISIFYSSQYYEYRFVAATVTEIRGIHQPNEPNNPIQTAPTQLEKSNPKLLGWMVGFVYVNPKLLDWVMGCGSHNSTQL